MHCDESPPHRESMVVKLASNYSKKGVYRDMNQRIDNKECVLQIFSPVRTRLIISSIAFASLGASPVACEAVRGLHWCERRLA